MLTGYPTPLLLQFFLLCLSFCIYIVDGIVICLSQSYKHFAVRLFICMMISQLFYIAPQLVIPFMLQDYQAVDDEQSHQLYPVIGYYSCKIYGYFIISSWECSAFTSIFMMTVVHRVLKGQQGYQGRNHEIKAIAFIACLCIVPNALFVKFFDFQNYGLTSMGDMQYYFCNIATMDIFSDNIASHKKLALVVIMGFVNVAVLVVAIGFWIVICRQKRQMMKVGVNLNYPVIKIWMFPVISILLWNFNLVIKMLDNLGGYHPESDTHWFVNGLWIAAHSVITLEGVYLSALFFHAYSSFLLPNLPPKLQKVVIVISYLSLLSLFSKSTENTQSLVEESCLYEEEESKEKDSTSLINQSVAK